MTSGLCELSGITGKCIDVFSDFCGSQPLWSLVNRFPVGKVNWKVLHLVQYVYTWITCVFANRRSICIHVITHSKRKFFSSTCPSDKHYIKLGCLKPMISCPKHFAWNSKLKNNWALSTWMLILGITGTVAKARFQRQIELVKRS